jgi:hypothetical protein
VQTTGGYCDVPETWIVVVTYAVGVLVGLVATDAKPAARVGLALLWPIGPAAFVVTLAVLAAASLIAFPIIGLAVVASAVAWLLLA